MTHVGPLAPRQFMGVMVSSTFADFTQHREALIGVISGQGLHPIAMEQDSALPAGTVIDSSLQKVRDAAGYMGIIGARYGNIPDSAEFNPERLSLTELEFREARALGRPILLFIMGPDHDVKQRDVETDPEKRRKLEAFREEAKNSSADSRVHRVYKVFNSLSEFEVAAAQSVAELRRFLDARAIPAGPPQPEPVPESSVSNDIPAPPALYAEPRYIGSHAFVGRAAQLTTLNDWAAPAEAHPVLLFEAIGGTGKSMLTWEWTTRHAPAARDDWAGRFWYSFYEKGAVLADFCRRALAYMTGRPLTEFQQKKQPELSELLMRQLQARCWLLILDGLERVLVAYHRYDAAQLADEQAGTTDEIAHRDPCHAIRPLDDDLLRQLAGAGPSKILITSRLIPRVLLNSANQPIPGVLHERLPGLRPADAEALLRTCGVCGDSQQMQDYLQRHCDCHPLVTGIVAGLVNDYLPGRGDFDSWAADPGHGGHLNLARVDLTQKRNHILTVALEALPDASRQLLSTLSLLPESFDYAILAALNPHLPPEPEAVPEPERPEDQISGMWEHLPKDQQEQLLREYAAALEQRREYEQAHAAWQAAPETLAAPAALTPTVRDLEQRGLLQYEHRVGRWDLHPVVRAVASSRLRDHDRDHLGQQIIDHFSGRPHDPYERAQTLDDLRDAITIVRTLFQMGRKEEAFSALHGDLLDPLLFNIEAYPEALSLMRPFFPHDWSAPSVDLTDNNLGRLANGGAYAFHEVGEFMRAAELTQIALRTDIANKNWDGVDVGLNNLTASFRGLNRLAPAEHFSILALRLAEALDSPPDVFRSRLYRFDDFAMTGRWDEAEEMWDRLDPMGRDWPRRRYRPGDAEAFRLEYLLFPLGRLTEEDLAAAEHLVRAGQNRKSIRRLYRLRGRWQLSRGEHALAAESFQDAIRMAHEAGLADPGSETLLVLARFGLGQLPNPREEAERVSAGRDPAYLPLAELWHALGDTEQAARYADAAYRYAWGDGEPYVRRYDLERAETLLRQLGADIPALPLYDPARDPKKPWEDRIEAAIAELQESARSEPQAIVHLP
jgi:tetratricopeptide (TPR) repeat protein